jgi:glycosyltransferase involved in cell wall biosynthesis
MRVLYVSSGLDPRTGGTATAAISVCLAAQRAGLEPTLAFPLAPDSAAAVAPLTAALDEAGIAHHAFAFAERRRAVEWGISTDLDRWLKRHVRDYDLVHAHSVWVMSSLAAVRAARRAGRPVVVMPHEGLTRFDMARAGNGWLKQAKRVLRWWYRLKTDRFILASELERLDSALPERSAVAIPHPVLDERLPAPAPRSFPADGPYTVGFLGRIHPKKNLHRLIRALPLVPDLRLVIGGDGPEREKSRLEDLISHHQLEDRVEWRGFVAAADKARFFREVDLIAMPSEFECFGLVAAEALGEGVPVLVSPTVGLAEWVEAGECGLVVPPRADAIAVALAKLGKDGLLARCAAKARATALRHFSFAAHGRALATLYADLTGRGSAHT